MDSRKTLVILAGMLAASSAHSSQIKRLSLDKLNSSAKAIVLAKVVRVKPVALDSRTDLIPWDRVILRVVSAVRGTFRRGTIELLLQCRGVKGFDPELKPGDVGVFFLKEIKGGKARLAYWGSVALFKRQNFD